MFPEEAMAMAQVMADIRKRRVMDALAQKAQATKQRLDGYRSSYDGSPSALELLMAGRERTTGTTPTVAMSSERSHASKVPYGYGG